MDLRSVSPFRQPGLGK
ncbi:hypothetical protein MTR67_031367 [Solanum verrucosum]|uniref:Uncharacterized protein n=1 Tax=Solanum verrucosum TaxID=315347 RepID=A0AAF0ZEV5_SOLVR|nr:hypothetical protein MTR67_031367 [Solanum verrucosum]